MIPFEEARERILSRTQSQKASEVSLHKRQEAWLWEPLGRALAEPLIATLDSPRFDNSSVDGYGVRCEDAPGRLTLIGSIAAGSPPTEAIGPGQAVRIFTGAPLPPGVEAVVMQEKCRAFESWVEVAAPPSFGENIRRRGEEYRAGEELLPAGAVVTPPVLGLLAANGIHEFRVHGLPSVGIVVTGNELVPPGGRLFEGQIFESNSSALAGAVRAVGAAAWVLVVGDDPEATREALRDVLHHSDVVITSGGVSVGDYDVVKDALEDLGVERVFWRIAMKPGKPVYFGVRGQTLVFGLPGNPVSALVTFYLLVRPALRKMMGHAHPVDPPLRARLREPLRKRAGRTEFVRGHLAATEDGLVVEPLRGQGSHMVAAAARADCLIRLPAETEGVAEGTAVEVYPLNWSAF